MPDWNPGMTVVDGDFVFSTSPTRKDEEPGKRSYLYVVTSCGHGGKPLPGLLDRVRRPQLRPSGTAGC
ncbi:hypothetical protein [Saccharopolyspora sp. NPDC002376]